MCLGALKAFIFFYKLHKGYQNEHYHVEVGDRRYEYHYRRCYDRAGEIVFRSDTGDGGYYHGNAEHRVIYEVEIRAVRKRGGYNIEHAIDKRGYREIVHLKESVLVARKAAEIVDKGLKIAESAFEKEEGEEEEGEEV